MFKAKDKNGQEIYIKDEVTYEAQDSMGGVRMEKGFVICLPQEETVQVQPVDEGEPRLLAAASLIVTDSLIQDLNQLSTNSEFQAYIAKIEERYEAIVKQPRGKRSSAKKAAAPRKALDVGEFKF